MTESPVHDRRALYERMVLVREFEEICIDIYRRGDFPGLVHASSGQEAASVGMCAVLDDRDHVVSTHRGHGHCIARGVEIEPMLAEIMGREGGLCGAKGGSMHVADVRHGMLGANGIVGGGLGIALGAAFQHRYRETGGVAVAFVGEGALNQGVVMETMNMAALWSLPLVYACENNGLVEYSRAEDVTAGDVVTRAASFGIHAVEVDGMDLDAVLAAAGEAVERGRRGEGPTFLNMRTYRYHGHHVAEVESGYRTDEEIASWRQRDPIELLARRLLDEGQLTETEIPEIAAGHAERIRAAHQRLRSAPRPDLRTVFTQVYAEP